MQPDSAETVWRGRLLAVTVERWGRNEREIVEHPGAVAIVSVDSEGEVAFVRQLREATRSHLLELPAGTREAGEEPLATAKRELVEECGYEAAQWWKITTLDPSIGYSTEVIHLYGARGLKHVGHKLDEGEHLETFQAKISDALEWIRDGMITDTKTTFGLLWWDRFGRFPD